MTGDGAPPIAELIERVNADPRRGARPLPRADEDHVDDVALAHLAAQRPRPGSVPAAGQEVSLRRNGNLSTGGTSMDVTDLVHPDVAELCRRAAARPAWTSAASTSGWPTSARRCPPAAGASGPAGGGASRSTPARGCACTWPRREGSAARRCRGDRRPAVPARRPVQDPDRRRDRHQRQDHDGPDDRAHPAPGRAAHRHVLHRRRLDRRPVRARGRRVRPPVGRAGARRHQRRGGRPGDRPGRDHPARPRLRQGRRRRDHQHQRRPPGRRRHRRPRRADPRQGAGRRGDQRRAAAWC